MLSIDITEASWAERQDSIISELVRTELDHAAKFTLMAYDDTGTALRFRAYFYSENQTLIMEQEAQSGSYIVVPSGVFYTGVELYSVTADQLFSAIMYADMNYDLPMHLELSIGNKYEISESNGIKEDYRYNVSKEQASDKEYRYETVKEGDLWIVIEHIT